MFVVNEDIFIFLHNQHNWWRQVMSKTDDYIISIMNEFGLDDVRDCTDEFVAESRKNKSNVTTPFVPKVQKCGLVDHKRVSGCCC